MENTASGPAGTRHEPYARLPKPMPRWMRRVIEVDTIVHIAILVAALLVILFGTVAWAVRGIT